MPSSRPIFGARFARPFSQFQPFNPHTSFWSLLTFVRFASQSQPFNPHTSRLSVFRCLLPLFPSGKGNPALFPSGKAAFGEVRFPPRLPPAPLFPTPSLPAPQAGQICRLFYFKRGEYSGEGKLRRLRFPPKPAGFSSLLRRRLLLGGQDGKAEPVTLIVALNLNPEHGLLAVRSRGYEGGRLPLVAFPVPKKFL